MEITVFIMTENCEAIIIIIIQIIVFSMTKSCDAVVIIIIVIVDIYVVLSMC